MINFQQSYLRFGPSLLKSCSLIGSSFDKEVSISCKRVLFQIELFFLGLNLCGNLCHMIQFTKRRICNAGTDTITNKCYELCFDEL